MEKRGHRFPDLKRDIATRLTRYVMQATPQNMHRRVEAAFNVNDAEHGHPVNLWKKMYGTALLPDGSEQWLLKIDDWDFNW